MNRPPRPIVDVLITTPRGISACRRFVFDLPTGHQRDGRGWFVKVGHATIPVSKRQIKNRRVTVSHTQLVNVPTDAEQTRTFRKVAQ